MNINIKQLLMVATLCVFAGCYYDNEEELYPNTGGANNTSDSVSYAATIAPMMATHCTTAGCHATGAQSPDLSNYTGVYNNRDRVKVRAVDGPNWMPSAGPMSQTNRNNLGKWIDAGAPNN